MEAKVRVSLVEDELLVRRLLEQLLGSRPELRLVHSVGGTQEARLVIGRGSSDVAVLDVNLQDGDGIALGLELQRRDPRLGILLLSGEDAMGAFLEAQEEAAKPWSYLSKRSTFAATTLIRAVVAAVRGEQVIDPYLVERSTPRAGSPVARLTPAQLRVLTLVAQGYANEAISQQLGIAVRSVENHLLSVYKVLGLEVEGRNRRVLATRAFIAHTSRRI